MTNEANTTTASEADFKLQNAGSIFVLYPRNFTATEWCNDHLPEDAQRWADGYVIEHRYVCDVIAGIKEDGLVIESL